jgi:hypothetical protein
MKQITGTWRLVTTRAKNDAGEVMHAPYGPKPMGLAAFDSYGRMIAVLCDGRTTLSVGEVDREFNAYSGNYTFDGDTLSTLVDAASDMTRLGGEQVRHVHFERDRLVLHPPPRTWKNMIQHRELIWERIAT